MSRMWDTIKGWATQNAAQYIYAAIPAGHADVPGDANPVRPHHDYFRVWLNEMYLTRSRRWFKDWFPAVNSSVSLKFGDRDQPIELTHVARAPQEALTKAVLLNFPVTELLPYRGGVVELEAALLALKGQDYLGAAIGILQNFSGLVGAPLGQALDIASNVAGGIDELVGATDGKVHLGLHQAFASQGGGGGNVLGPGYFAVILATTDDIDPDRLRVVKDRLHYAGRPGQDPEPFASYDYMLFRLERREERDDWRMSNIEEPLRKAIEAALKGNEEEGKALVKTAVVNAYSSDDLAVKDRRRVIQAIKDEYREVADLGLGAVGGEERDLNGIMGARAMTVATAEAKGKLSLEEALIL